MSNEAQALVLQLARMGYDRPEMQSYELVKRLTLLRAAGHGSAWHMHVTVQAGK